MLSIANKTFNSRLLTGTGKFSHPQALAAAVATSGTELVTLAMKRLQINESEDLTLQVLQQAGVTLLPNTSGAKDANEAVYAAQLAREALGTTWIKLEIHPDQRYLLPDPVETLIAAQALVKQGFTVLPYCGADPVLCKRLEEAGCAAVMPLAAPIGSNRGLITRDFLQMIVEQAFVPVIVDAGIGKPSDAMAAMEMGVDAVLVNTAIATAKSPAEMAGAFKLAVEAGRRAYNAGIGPVSVNANSSSPLTGFLDARS